MSGQSEKKFSHVGSGWARKRKPGDLEVHATQSSHWYSVAASYKEQ